MEGRGGGKRVPVYLNACLTLDTRPKRKEKTLNPNSQAEGEERKPPQELPVAEWEGRKEEKKLKLDHRKYIVEGNRTGWKDRARTGLVPKGRKCSANRWSIGALDCGQGIARRIWKVKWKLRDRCTRVKGGKF